MSARRLDDGPRSNLPCAGRSVACGSLLVLRCHGFLACRIRYQILADHFAGGCPSGLSSAGEAQWVDLQHRLHLLLFPVQGRALSRTKSTGCPAATLEAYIRQLLESHRAPQVTVAWQGGEPTLMKVEFFRHSVELVEKYRRPDQVVQHTFQTNGILLDDEWCAFFKEHNFLVGLSVDGPRELHDTYRVDRRKRGTFDRVMQGWRALRRHGVEFNILCTVNAANEKHGRRVYHFFRDELGAKWVQFIPIVERATEETLQLANQGWSEQAERQAPALYADRQPGHRANGGCRAIRPLSRRCLRGMGAPRCRQGVRAAFRRDPGSVFRAPSAVHPCTDLRLRPGARIQRRSVFLRSFRRAAISSSGISTRPTC